MKVYISEFSYGFAFTENLIRANPNSASFPSFLTQFRERSLGYDVMIKLKKKRWTPYFFQFKIPDIMRRETAYEKDQYGLNIAVPYYRMKLYNRDSYNQQNVLARLEEKNPNSVFYATPEFHEQSDLSKNYFNGTIIENSALFSPLEIQNIIDSNGAEKHTIAYEENSTIGYLCSEPTKIDNFSFKKILLENSDGRREDEQSLEVKIKKLTESTLSAINVLGYRFDDEYFNSRVEEYISIYRDDYGIKYEEKYFYEIHVLNDLVQDYINSSMFIIIDNS